MGVSKAEEEMITAETLKDELKELQGERERLEQILIRNTTYLETTPVGLAGSLLDAEGFPRSDVDAYAVRQARHDIAIATTDVKAVMERMREKMFALHEATRADTMAVMQEQQPREDDPEREAARAKAAALMERSAMRSALPFLKVVSVARGGPAESAGLRAGDLISRFGDLKRDEFAAAGGTLQLVAGRLREGEIVDVLVRRADLNDQRGGFVVVQCPLVPTKWSGPGLIGCVLDAQLE